MCEDARKGYGTVNLGQYCNPKMDAVLDKALYTTDDRGAQGCCRKRPRSWSMTASSRSISR
uniref:Uncharacterized protein n=1 Tax=Ralstonia solanacearum TaxID=305 RepID=A0A0S4U0A6_RALSL|nr:protein of unknown function [Ralstonia solanacearum]